MPDKLSLYISASVEIQLEIGGGWLDIFMTKMILDIGDGGAAVEHVDGAWMPETVYRVDIL